MARRYAPSDLEELVRYVKKDDLVLDAGCGSGYLYPLLNKADYIGVDFSEKLIEIARTRYPEGCFQRADLLGLDFRDNYFDEIFSIGVLHQIPSKEKRRQFLREMHRVLKPGGILTIRVWNLWEKKKRLILKYALLKMIRKTKLDFKDLFLLKNNMYYHAFSKRELKKIVEREGFLIKEVYLKGKGVKSNIYLRAVAVF